MSITYIPVCFQEHLQAPICRRSWDTEERLRAFRPFLVFSNLRKSTFIFWMTKPFTLNFKLYIFFLPTNYTLNLLLL